MNSANARPGWIRRTAPPSWAMAFDEGPGRHLRAQDRDLRARLPHPAGRLARLCARGHHLRPQHLRHRHRHRGARQLRGRTSSRPRAGSSNTCPALGVISGGEQRQFSFRGNDRCARPSTPCSSPRHPGRHGHGHRQRRPRSRFTTSFPGAARAGGRRGAQPPPDGRAPAGNRRAGQGRRGKDDSKNGVAQRPVGKRLTHRARARHHRLHQGRHRRGVQASPAAGVRWRSSKAADGRHERQSATCSRRQDVPAAGGQERVMKQAAAHLPPHIEAEKQAQGCRRRRAQQGQDRVVATVSLGRRTTMAARTSSPVPQQQLRGREHGRDGPRTRYWRKPKSRAPTSSVCRA